MAWRARATPSLPVKTVAQRLRFTDVSAFARAFWRQFGLTPTQFWPMSDRRFLVLKSVRGTC